MEKHLYRKEIDGLRAVAIIPVVLFHADFSLFSGGYVGVDIFYVISGYLITSIIYREIVNHEFTYRRFWMRRARRILPASFFMVIVCIPTFAFLFPTGFYQRFLDSVIANQLFASNIYFWKQGGYFSIAQEVQPLLHTWSLSIEEQFYFVFPILLILFYRISKRFLLTILWFAIIISFALCVYASKYHSYAAFYLIPTRAWELGLGAVAAITLSNTKFKLPFSGICQIAGLLMIFVSIIYFDEQTPFPSYYAALPTFGTMLLILSKNTRSVVDRFLTWGPTVYIGLISYSVYLWHWPIMVLRNWLSPADSLGTLTVISVLMAFAFGSLSYKFVERPTRSNILMPNGKLIYSLTAGFVIIFLMTMGMKILGNGILVDKDGSIQMTFEKALEPEPRRSECTDIFRKGIETLCSVKANLDDKIDYFVWGDSHAGAMMPAFLNLSKLYSINIEYSISSGCQPVFGMHRVDQFQACFEINKKVLDYIQKKKYPNVILIGSFVNNLRAGKLRDINGLAESNSEIRMSEFRKRFNETIEKIKSSGSNVYVFVEPPRFKISPPLENLRARTLRTSSKIPVVTLSDHLERTKDIYSIIESSNIDKLLNYDEFFCPENKCLHTLNGQSLYKDSGHVSNFGAEQLVPFLAIDLNL